MNKVNLFHILTTPIPIISISSFSIAKEVILVANLGKSFLSKETARSNKTFLPR